MRLVAILSALAGLVLAEWLPFLNFGEVLTVLASAGASLTIVITLHGGADHSPRRSARIVTGPHE